MITADPPICDYEGSDYRTRFWEDQGREYEDAVERIAIQQLLPPAGELLMDIGAGYGRLAELYAGYRRVVLFDYSRSQLEYARERLGAARTIYVVGNFYQLPFVAGLFDAITQVRTIHHAADAPAVFAQVQRVLRPAGVFILEFANKQNLKAIARYLLRRQRWSPFDHQPVEFVPLNYDFHPAWIREQLSAAGLFPGRTLTVSHFRLALLKRLLPTSWLVSMDRRLQPSGRWWQLTPSVFLRSHANAAGPLAAEGAFFLCPQCLTPLATPPGLCSPQDQDLGCPGCSRAWPIRDGIYNFKTNL